MLNWQQKQIGHVTRELKANLARVGEAHLAAQEENARAKAIEEQKVRNRKLALRRGKIAAEQLGVNRQKGSKPIVGRGGAGTAQATSVEKPRTKKHVSVATQVNDSVNSSNMSSCSLSSSSSSLSVSSPSVCIEDDPSFVPSTRTLAERLQSQYIPKSSHLSRPYYSEDEIEHDVSRVMSPKKKKKSVTYESGRRDVNGNDERRKSDTTPPSILKGARKSVDANGNDTDSLLQDTPLPIISRVSDMLKKDRDAAVEMPKSSLHKTNEEAKATAEAPPRPIIVNKKPNERATGPQSILKHTRAKSASPKPQLKPILKNSASRMQKTPKKSAVKQSTAIEKRQQTPFHYVPRFVTEAPVQRPKVQFYDHANRFGKEYEAESSLVQTHKYDGAPSLNAMEEAKLEVEREQRRLAEMAEAR